MLRIKVGEEIDTSTREGQMTKIALDVRDTGARLCLDAPEYNQQTNEGFCCELRALKERINGFLEEFEEDD